MWWPVWRSLESMSATCDWSSKALTYHISTTDLQNLLKSNKWQFPTHNEDLLGAMAAMFRLQDTYNISAVDMADNNIIGERRRGLSQINELILWINVSILTTAHLPLPLTRHQPLFVISWLFWVRGTQLFRYWHRSTFVFSPRDQVNWYLVLWLRRTSAEFHFFVFLSKTLNSLHVHVNSIKYWRTDKEP